MTTRFAGRGGFFVVALSVFGVPGQAAPPCGTELASYRGVAARSNGANQYTGESCAGRGPYGLQYQCVEYVRRFYDEAMEIDTGLWPRMNAVDFFARANDLGLVTYENSLADSPPAPDDILVFASNKNAYGHIAIVTQVNDDLVEVIEQNWSLSGMATLSLLSDSTGFSIAPRGSYYALGWLRLPSAGPTELVLQPGPTDGKDIWTTSVYSYAPGGGGPGGGLNDETLVTGGWADEYRSLIEFDLNDAPLAISATLHLYCYHSRSGAVTGLYFDRITESWDWRTMGTGPDHERLWWADRPDYEQWFFDPLPAPTIGEWYTVDITELYNSMRYGLYDNFGFQLRPVSTDNRWAEFYSSDYLGDPAKRPKLVVVPATIFPE